MKGIESISPITFPGLGIEIDPAAGFSIGSFSFNFYGLIIAIGLMLAVVYAWKRCSQFGLKTDDITDGVIYIVPFAVLCAISDSRFLRYSRVFSDIARSVPPSVALAAITLSATPAENLPKVRVA